MIIELTKENFFLIDDSFINKLYLEHEFANNPYAKVLILKEKQNIIGYIYYSDMLPMYLEPWVPPCTLLS